MTGKELRNLIENRGFQTQGQFANVAGITEPKLSNILRGARPITSFYAGKIQKALDRGPEHHSAKVPRK